MLRYFRYESRNNKNFSTVLLENLLTVKLITFQYFDQIRFNNRENCFTVYLVNFEQKQNFIFGVGLMRFFY